MSFSLFFRPFAVLLLLAAGCQWCLAAERDELDAIFAEEPAGPDLPANLSVPTPLPEVHLPTSMNATTSVDLSLPDGSLGTGAIGTGAIGTGPISTGSEPDSQRPDRTDKNPKSVPVAEPTSFGLLAVGLLFVLFLARGRRMPGVG